VWCAEPYLGDEEGRSAFASYDRGAHELSSQGLGLLAHGLPRSLAKHPASLGTAKGEGASLPLTPARAPLVPMVNFPELSLPREVPEGTVVPKILSRLSLPSSCSPHVPASCGIGFKSPAESSLANFEQRTRAVLGE
jgi:hypothetical protein